MIDIKELEEILWSIQLYELFDMKCGKIGIPSLIIFKDGRFRHNGDICDNKDCPRFVKQLKPINSHFADTLEKKFDMFKTPEERVAVMYRKLKSEVI